MTRRPFRRGGPFRGKLNRAPAEPLASSVSDPDVRLMLAFQAGDEDAFTRLVERYTGPIINYFYFQGGDLDLAEDCAQELWVKIYRSRESYVPKARFSTYLFRIARNHWIDHYRVRSRRPTESSLTHGSSEEGSLQPLTERLPAPSSDPATRMDQQEVARMLARALEKIPEEMREVYVLGEVEQKPYTVISEILGIPVGTVKSRMFHAVRRLREILRHGLEMPR